VALGFAPPGDDAIRGGDPGHNAEVTRHVLRGARGGPRDVVVLNAAAAIVVAGLADDLAAGVRAAEESIDSGAAAERLARFVAATGRLAVQGGPA
jgi:anthranilate phosphoribosyltransferase